MFSKWNSPFRKLGPRLILWFTASILFSVICVSATIYILLARSLRDVDREFIRARSMDYKQVYERGGLQALKDIVALQRGEDDEDELLISLVDNKNAEIFTYMPSFLDHDEEDAHELEAVQRDSRQLPLKTGWHTLLIFSDEDTWLERLEDNSRKFALEQGWSDILPIIDYDLFEVYILQLGDGLWMKIGKNPEPREEQLMRVRSIAGLVLIPFILLGTILGYLLARGVLHPIRHMVQTIQQIKSGNKTARVQQSGSQDELDQLASQFNGLLDSNQQLMNSMRQTLDNVAHDLRTPMTRFRMGAELALQNMQDQELVKDTLTEGIESSESIGALLNAIMDVAEAEAGAMHLNLTPLSVSGLLHKLSDLYQYVAEEKEITLTVIAENDVQILGDQVRLAQCLGNILDNALKYSPAKTAVQLSLAIQNKQAIIAISDQGPGISPEDVSRIWERLYRGDASRSTPGMGIGLSLVQAVVKAHHGRIEVDSTPGVGTTFRLFLPITQM